MKGGHPPHLQLLLGLLHAGVDLPHYHRGYPRLSSEVVGARQILNLVVLQVALQERACRYRYS